MGLKGDDGSYALVKSLESKIKNLRVWQLDDPNVRETANFLIDKARSDIIVADDADNLFTGDVDKIVEYFRDPKVGAIIQFDVCTREYLNRGMIIFENAYQEVQLKKYLNGNIVTDPIFSVHIYRKSGIDEKDKVYTRTWMDDNEITKKLMDRGYNVIYDKELANHIENSPLQDRLTISGIFRRRIRSSQFRRQAKEMLNTDRFSIRTRIMDWVHAFLITCARVNIIEFFEVCEWYLLVALATINAEIYIRIKKDTGKFVRLRGVET